jgi:acyl-CoA thioesterase I
MKRSMGVASRTPRVADASAPSRAVSRRAMVAKCSRTALTVAWAGLCAPWALAQANAGAKTSSAPAVSAVRPPGTILVVGDSLSAEYGLQRGTGWVALMEQRLARSHPSARVVNASISGDTTSGGRSRLPTLLRQHKPSIVVIELGGNDALRGLPLTMTRDNLAAMARSSKDAGALVVLVGMQVPPNYGRGYAKDFFSLFADVAKAERTELVPFLLEGVADIPNADAMFQSDRIHPNESAHPKMLDNVWTALSKMLPRRS